MIWSVTESMRPILLTLTYPCLVKLEACDHSLRFGEVCSLISPNPDSNSPHQTYVNSNDIVRGIRNNHDPF